VWEDGEQLRNLVLCASIMNETRASTTDLATSTTPVETKRDANEDAHVRRVFFNQHQARLSGICWLFWSVSIVPRWVLTRHVAKIIVHARWRETSGVSTCKIALAWANLRWFSIMLHNQNGPSVQLTFVETLLLSLNVSFW